MQVLTENSPFTQGPDELYSGGEATVFVRKLLDTAGIAYELEYLPWRRAYRYALSEPNVVLYPLARSGDREAHFDWIGQLIPVSYYLFKLRSREDIVINHLNQARNYRVGVVNFHIHHQFLKSEGFENLHPVNSTMQNIKKAILGRIDLFPVSDGGLIPFCQQKQIDCSQFEPVLKLTAISGHLYIAFSGATDTELVESARSAYSQLLANGTHQRLFRDRIEQIDRFNARWPAISSQ